MANSLFKTVGAIEEHPDAVAFFILSLWYLPVSPSRTSRSTRKVHSS